jgi:RimJ/RimL family protein N-acetyltransferase
MQHLATIETERLFLRRPERDDLITIFQRYASDPEVTRFLAWPRHRSLADTEAFLAFSDAEWQRWPVGPYLILSGDDGTLLGATGLRFVTASLAETGYVLARDAWGQGYATEALRSMIGIAPEAGVQRLFAHIHFQHRASARVLEKCGFILEGPLSQHTEFPNLASNLPADVLCYAMDFTPRP